MTVHVFAAIGRMLLGSAIRRALWRSPRAVLIVAALVGFALMSIGTARAQVVGTCGSNAQNDEFNICADQSHALSQCQAAGANTKAQLQLTQNAQCQLQPAANGLRSYYCHVNGYACFRGTQAQAEPTSYFTYRTTQTACPAGSVRMLNGQCSATPEQCQALNSQPGFGVQTAKPFQQRCLANGCMLSLTPGTGSCSAVAGADGNICHGEYSFTGETCGATPPPVFIPGPDTVEAAAKNDPQACTALGGGSHNYCVKRNGDHCMTSAQGRQLCWKPGETGTKTDGPVAQVRNAGQTANAPDLNLPSGDTLQSTGQSATASSGGTTTTTTNYTTIFGTNAGPKNQGEKNDGSGDGKEQDPDKNTASGGEDCERRPIVSDPAFEMIANQAWATRCAVEAGNAADVTGDIEKCDQPFTVNGDNANAVKLRAMRAQICGTATRVVGDVSDCNSTFSVQGDTPDAHQLRAMRTQICGDQGVEWDAIGDAVAAVDATAGEGDPSSVVRDIGGSDGDGELDTSGLGYGRSCPTLPSVTVMGTTLDFNAHAGAMCRWMQLAGQLVLVLAALVSLRIIAT